MRRWNDPRFKDEIAVPHAHGGFVDRPQFRPGKKARADALAEARKRIAELEEFAREVRDNYDCDSDAHRYGTMCRACEAEKVLPKEGT